MSSEKNRRKTSVELWGGVECTINRVGNEYHEQLRRTGHVSRVSDLDRFAALGIKALRQPILWECSPSHEAENEKWNWAQAVLRRLGRLGIRPIVGLVHHGSGPQGTHLLDPDFATGVAKYAGQVALRFPEVQDYTPINEPLTTARFSALYGHWYPHRRDECSFARALLNQCRAVVLSMQAVRRINPAARLIQTDDLGKIYSTPALSYQADFENERRWAAYDLLCGRIDRSHRMWRHFLWAGIGEAELEWFLDHRCPPDVIGLNHYLSGERYIDEHLDRYPSDTHGGNGTHNYADVLASRVLHQGTPGPRALMMEAWERYRIPIAITECHNGCTREEQLRWFLEVWKSAEEARQMGADVVAVTAWALLGAFDWNSLVTQRNNHYEPGVYDVRSTAPRPTALAKLIHQLAAKEEDIHPLLEVPGWWRRPRRFVYGIAVDDSGKCQPVLEESINRDHPHARPVLITGANGTLGRAFVRICEQRGIPYRAVTRRCMDIADASSIRRTLEELRPWAVINTAGYVRVDDAELEPMRCFRDNTVGAHMLARECDAKGISFLTFSSDLVFDGRKNKPYLEGDTEKPLSVYGCSKAEAEHLVAEAMPSALVVRSSAFFGPWDESNFVFHALRALRTGRDFFAANDVTVSPTYVPDLVNACLDLLIDAESGVWHLTNKGQISWSEFAKRAAALAGINPRTLRAESLSHLQFKAARPLFSALDSERATLMPTFEDALARYFPDREVYCASMRTASELTSAAD